jgi:hypothetical protein
VFSLWWERLSPRRDGDVFFFGTAIADLLLSQFVLCGPIPAAAILEFSIA